MPRIDPDTGVEVLTTNEMWSRIAEEEGKETYEVIEDFFSEMEHERQQEEARLYELDYVRDRVSKAFDPDEEKPVELIRVIDASYNMSLSHEGIGLEVEAKRGDGSVGIVKYHYSHWAATRLEPPDYEEWAEWKE